MCITSVHSLRTGATKENMVFLQALLSHALLDISRKHKEIDWDAHRKLVAYIPWVYPKNCLEDEEIIHAPQEIHSARLFTSKGSIGGL